MDATTDPEPLVLDPANAVHARAIARLRDEQIAWIISIRPNGFPHAVPVWFLWHDNQVIIFSEPGTVKLHNMRANPHALVHLEAGPAGEYLTVLQGLAEISDQPATAWIDRIGDAYGTKYATGLAGLKLTLQQMAAQYSVVTCVTPTKLTAW